MGSHHQRIDFWEPLTGARRREGVEPRATTGLLDVGARTGSARTMPSRSERARTAAVRSDMTAAFEDVFAAHRDQLVRALSVTLRDDALAAEAVDEAFTRALHRWHVVGSFENPQAWVYRTARNWATSSFRRRSRDRRYAHRVGTPDASSDSLPDPALTEALSSLSDDHRNVLVLRYYLDWSVESIADALDISSGTVKSRTHRALTELNRKLGGSR